MEDVAPLLHAALLIGHTAFTKLRRQLNGDGQIQYRVDMDRKVYITSNVLDKLRALGEKQIEDNLERPFFMIFDEATSTAVDIVIGRVGDENYCEHDILLVNKAKEALSGYPTARMSRGHTHPVFYSSDFDYQQGRRHRHDRAFGTLPSNVFGDLSTWQRRAAMTSGEQEQAYLDIVRSKWYKRFCEDYVESYYASHVPGFNCSSGPMCSEYHWVFCPRLNQLGVFRVPKDGVGVVVYHCWQAAGNDNNLTT